MEEVLKMNTVESQNEIDQNAKEGFKKTKLGWIPEEWEIKEFQDFASFFSGGTPKTSNKKYYSGTIPFIKSGEIGKKKTKEFINDEALKNSSAKLIHKNDLLMALYGANSGEVAISKISGAINQAVLCIRLKENYDKIFTYNFLLHKKETIIRKYLQGGQGNLSSSIIKGISFALPSFYEQKAIATCLSTWDTAITKLDALIKAKQQLKKALMQQLLNGKKRLPGFEGEWEDLHFSDISERVNRKNIEADDTVVTISAQRGFVLQEDYFNKRVASDTLLNYTLVHNGEYCYNKSYSKDFPMGAFKRLDAFEKAVVTTLYICFSLKENVDSDFMNQYFEAGKMIPGLMRIAQEGGRAHGLLNISLTDFFNLPVILPKIEEQIAIAHILNTADKEIKLLTTQLEQFKLQKRGLMQQLLTGKKRLKYNG